MFNKSSDKIEEKAADKLSNYKLLVDCKYGEIKLDRWDMYIPLPNIGHNINIVNFISNDSLDVLVAHKILKHFLWNEPWINPPYLYNIPKHIKDKYEDLKDKLSLIDMVSSLIAYIKKNSPYSDYSRDWSKCIDCLKKELEEYSVPRNIKSILYDRDEDNCVVIKLRID